jgi:hypothetical protein
MRSQPTQELEELFFFEKKNQKTFTRWAVPTALPAPRNSPLRESGEKSLFASFSSEKEAFLAHLLIRILLPVFSVFAVSGCDHGGSDVAQTFGGLVDVPFEFEVTTRTPLEMPKTDSLVPPNPEASGPPQQSLRQQAESALAPQLALAAAASPRPSPGEEALLKAAGPPAPKNIRALVDNAADERRTARGMSDMIEFWRPRSQPIEETLDATAETARLKAAKTSGKSLTDGPIPIIKAQNPSVFQGLF